MYPGDAPPPLPAPSQRSIRTFIPLKREGLRISWHLADGEEGPCGWLKDPFGFSWQVVPTAFVELMQRADALANARMFQTMLGMKKLDLGKLRAAYEE